MLCALTGSQPLDCKDSVGGIREIKVKVHTGSTFVGHVTYTSGTITTIAAGSLTGWYTYNLETETASANNNGNFNPQNGTTWYQQEVKIIMNKLSARLSYEFDQMAKAKIIVSFRDLNDVCWVFGYEFGCDVTAMTAGTGTARGDRNGYEVTLTGKEKISAPTISSAIYATLVS
jgi:hypothetical protein